MVCAYLCHTIISFHSISFLLSVCFIIFIHRFRRRQRASELTTITIRTNTHLICNKRRGNLDSIGFLVYIVSVHGAHTCAKIPFV